MKSLNLFLESNWISTYKNSDQLWLSDSLNWDKTLEIVTFDWSLISFIFNSSFLNQYLLIDQSTKLSYLDTLLINSILKTNNIQTLYDSFTNDLVLYLNIQSLSLTSVLQSEYQENITNIIFLAPELSIVLNNYFNNYYINSIINFLPAPVFDLFLNNFNFFYNNTLIYFFMFFFYIFFIIYFFLTTISLNWLVFVNSYWVRFYYYFYSLSKEMRAQFEALAHTILFFLLYWGLVLMSFDDDQEEVIEFVDTMFAYFIMFMVLYLIYKHSVHLFSFFSPAISESRTVTFASLQFKNDIMETGFLVIRCGILLFRLNMYDLFDDILDSYYVLIIDFDDDEYLNELFFSLHGTLFFTNDNQDDRSFLLEDENAFSNDLFYLYFIVWGKINFWVWFLLEELAKLGVALMLIYIILFEVYSVSCSYKEDFFLFNKKN